MADETTDALCSSASELHSEGQHDVDPHVGKFMPSLRFRGFTEPWEERKLGDLLEVSKERNEQYCYSKEDVLSVSKEHGVVNQIRLQGRSFAGDDVGHYKVVAYGDIVYTKSPLKQNPYGIIKANSGEDGIVSPLYAVFMPSFDASPGFIQAYFEQNARLNNYLRPLVNKGAKNSMQISSEQVISGFIPCPTLPEQRAIGALFEKLDALVLLNERKHDRLVAFKKSLLDKMFPEPGATVPALRLAGFTEPWEQCKLEEIALRLDSARVPVTEKYRTQGSTPYYGANGVLDYVEGFTHEGEFILIAEDGASDLDDYPTFCVSGKIWVNNHAHVLQAIGKKSDNKFISWALKRHDIKTLLTGGTRAKLNSEALMGMTVSRPSLPEQRAIGALFDNLDSLIQAQQQKVDRLRAVKASLLDKMFV